MSSSVPIKTKEHHAEDSESVPQEIERFVRQLQSRLNWRQTSHLLASAFLVGAVLSFLLAVGYFLWGYPVPAFWPVAIFMLAMAGGLWIALLRWVSLQDAAHFADQFFGLKDSLRSFLGMKSRWKSRELPGEFYQLQTSYTAVLIRNRNSTDYQVFMPLKRLAAAAVIFGLVGYLSMLPPSESVQNRRATEAATLEATLAINQQLEQLVNDLDESIDDELERKLLNPDELRQWVEELRQTRDPKEAMRQYARLERKLNRASLMLAKRQDENLLTAAGNELLKDRQNKELGQQLKQKKYEAAAKQLEEFKQQAREDGDKTKSAKLAEQKKQLARLKAAANRMQAAARQLRPTDRETSASQQSSSQRMSDSQSGNSNASGSPMSAQEAEEMKNSNQNADGKDFDDQELADLLEELDQAVEDYDEILKKAEENDQDLDEQDLEECEACRQRVNDELEQLGEKLRRLAKMRQARSRLKKLAQQCSECQSGLIPSSRPGGKQAGKGTSDVTRDENDEPVNNDQYTRLKGVQGQGPALTKIEAANDGTGVSGRRSQTRERDFAKQFESFVQREDVPEDLKQGVKNYFTRIHQGEVADDQAANPADRSNQ